MTEKRIMFHNKEEVYEFVTAASKCDFDIDVIYQHVHVDAKSILGVLGMGLQKELQVRYSGANIGLEKALEKLNKYAVA